MTIIYSKEILHRPGDTSELTFSKFFNLVDEIIQSYTIRYGPEYRISSQLALYSKENDSITLFRIHTTSDDDSVNIGKCIEEILSRESNYDYYVGGTQILAEGGTSEDKGEKIPAFNLYGRDLKSEDVPQENPKRRVYKLKFGVPRLDIIGFEL